MSQQLHYRVLKDLPPDGYRTHVIPAGADAWFEHQFALDLIASGHIVNFDAPAPSPSLAGGVDTSGVPVRAAGETQLAFAERLSAHMRGEAPGVPAGSGDLGDRVAALLERDGMRPPKNGATDLRLVRP